VCESVDALGDAALEKVPLLHRDETSNEIKWKRTLFARVRERHAAVTKSPRQLVGTAAQFTGLESGESAKKRNAKIPGHARLKELLVPRLRRERRRGLHHLLTLDSECFYVISRNLLRNSEFGVRRIRGSALMSRPR